MSLESFLAGIAASILSGTWRLMENSLTVYTKMVYIRERPEKPGETQKVLDRFFAKGRKQQERGGRWPASLSTRSSV